MSHHLLSRSSSRKAASMIFSFFLAFCLALSAAGIAVMSHVLFSSLLMPLFNDQYCEGVKTHIEEQAMYYTLPTGFPTEVLNGVFDSEEIKSDVKNYVVSTYKNQDYKPSTTLLQERIVNNVNAYIASAGQTPTDETTQAIAGYATDIAEIYVSGIQVPGMAAFRSMRKDVMLYGGIAIMVLLLLAVALVVTIKRMHHFIHRAQRYWGMAVGGAALMCLIVPLGVFLMRPHRGLNFTPEYFYNFGVGLIDHILMSIIISGVVLLIIAVALILISEKGRSDVVVRSSRHSHRHSRDFDFEM